MERILFGLAGLGFLLVVWRQPHIKHAPFTLPERVTIHALKWQGFELVAAPCGFPVFSKTQDGVTYSYVFNPPQKGLLYHLFGENEAGEWEDSYPLASSYGDSFLPNYATHVECRITTQANPTAIREYLHSIPLLTVLDSGFDYRWLTTPEQSRFLHAHVGRDTFLITSTYNEVPELCDPSDFEIIIEGRYPHDR